MSTEPDKLVPQLLRDLGADMVTKAELRSEMHALRGEQVVGLRRTVVEDHTSVIGHGIIISGLEARLRRVEQHLDQPPLEAH